MSKTFRQQDNIGRAKYTVSFHDGKKTHKDGSPFHDIRLFRNRKVRDRFTRDLRNDGYSEM
jgi:hypothetical protein